MANPFQAILDVRREERPLSFLMFGYFFLIITTFWILKPIKKSLFIRHYQESGFDLLSWHMSAAQAELLAKVLNMVVAMAAVTVFSWLANRFVRQHLTFIFSGFFMVAYVLYTFVINDAAGVTVWSFYLFGDLYSTLMVATFFAFLNDSTTPDSAKRLYGLVGLGGVVGGVFGSTFVRVWIRALSESDWLWICLAVAALIVALAAGAGRLVDRDRERRRAEVRETGMSGAGDEPTEQTGPAARSLPENERAARDADEKPAGRGSAAMQGAKLVFSSRYLLSIAGIVGLYEVVSTIMDFQFTATVAHYLRGEAVGAHLSTMYAITNWTSMIVQFFFTSLVMTRFGVGVALLVLPVAALGGSAAFLALPLLWTGSFLNTADNGFSYSINQSAKEALYVPTTRDEKYKAKAFIDMFVQRFAKAIAVGISLSITMIFKDFSSLRWLSLVTIAVVVLWVVAARYAGRGFEARAD